MSQQNKIITDEDILNLASLIENMNINNDGEKIIEEDLINDNVDSSQKTKNINYNYFNNLFGPNFDKLDKNQQKLKIYNYLIEYLSNLYKM